MMRGDMSNSRSTDNHEPRRMHELFRSRQKESIGRRVLVVAPQPFYQDRGTPIAVRQLLEALSQRGEKVDLLTYPVGESIELPGLRILRIGAWLPFRDVPIGLSLQKLFFDIALFPSMFRQLKRESYRCIHAVEEAVFPAIVAGKRFNIPVIYDMQSSLPQQLLKHRILRGAAVQRRLRALERWAIAEARFILCSAGLKNYVRTVNSDANVMEWCFPSLAPHVSRVEIEKLRDELGIEKTHRVILYTGNFESYQGLFLLLEAFAEVVSRIPDAVLLLVGCTNNDQVLISNAASELKRRGALKVLPRQSRKKLSRFLAMADVLVSPRIQGDNLPLKIFDYLAAGRPIVATDSPTHRAVLNDENALLAKPSADEFGKAIAGLLQNPEEAVRLGNAAYTYSRQHLGWNSFCELVSFVYERVNALGSEADVWRTKCYAGR